MLARLESESGLESTFFGLRLALMPLGLGLAPVRLGLALVKTIRIRTSEQAPQQFVVLVLNFLNIQKPTKATQTFALLNIDKSLYEIAGAN